MAQRLRHRLLYFRSTEHWICQENTYELNWPKPTTLNIWKRTLSAVHLPVIDLLRPGRKNSGIETQSHPGVQLAQVCRGPAER